MKNKLSSSEKDFTKKLLESFQGDEKVMDQIQFISLIHALNRAEILLDATMRFMNDNPIAAEYQVDYDGADCDGSCLANDCEAAVEDIKIQLDLLRDLKRKNTVREG